MKSLILILVCAACGYGIIADSLGAFNKSHNKINHSLKGHK